MCIAIYKPADKEITKETLETCFRANGDGCGFAYINTTFTGDRKIKIKKSLDFDTFYRQYSRALEVDPESPFLIHFRIKTHGPVNKANCHPFKIDNDHAFIHNGVISGVGFDVEKSDTRLFNDKVLRKLNEGWMDREEIKLLVEQMIAHSKLVVLNLDGDIQIYNEDKGNWKDGIWFSNYSYKETTYQPRVNKSWKKCDKCSGSFHPNVFSYFCDLEEFKIFCPKCTGELKRQGMVYSSDEITKSQYDMWAPVEPIYADTATYTRQ